MTTEDDIEKTLTELVMSVPQTEWDSMMVIDVREAVNGLDELLGCCDDCLFQADPDLLRQALQKFIDDEAKPKQEIDE